ncbi:MAG: hypothetical protein J5835_07780, partial [Bacteroidales bacterium]|nr:hypothetical protein [Bacteroidales bacterium]
SVTFTTPDPQGFTGGTVKGTVVKVKEDAKDGVFQQGNLATATATVLPLDAEDPIGKAKKLKDNTYVVQKVGGTEDTRNFTQKWSQWEQMPMTDPKTDQTTMYVNLNLEDADEDGGTRGGAYFSVPESVIGRVQNITAKFFQENPWASVMAFTFKDPAAGHTAGEILAKSGGDGEGGMFGNMKDDGSNQILIQEKAGTKSYDGLYQILFHFTFHNTMYIWNPDKGEYGDYDEIDDGDYVMYGNALVEKYIPPVRTFTLSPHQFYLGYGGSGQVLEVEYTPTNAKWDWYDLEIDPSYGDKFKYYPDSHKIAINTLASGADAHVLGVQVKFWLKSDHSVYDYVYVDMNQQPR